MTAKQAGQVLHLVLAGALILIIGLGIGYFGIAGKSEIQNDKKPGWSVGEPWVRFAYSPDADTMTMLVWTGAESMPVQTFTLYHEGKGAGAPPDSFNYSTPGASFTLVIVRPIDSTTYPDRTVPVP